MGLEKMPVALTEEERSMRAREAARLHCLADEREEHKKEVVKELGDEIKTLRAEATAAARAANTGVEDREVPVSPRLNNERLIVEYYRDDTGDLVRQRPMTDDEARIARQRELPLRAVQGGAVELRTAPPVGQSPLRGNTRAPLPPAPPAANSDGK